MYGEATGRARPEGGGFDTVSGQEWHGQTGGRTFRRRFAEALPAGSCVSPRESVGEVLLELPDRSFEVRECSATGCGV